jgi:hypothetical protein
MKTMVEGSGVEGFMKGYARIDRVEVFDGQVFVPYTGSCDDLGFDRNWCLFDGWYYGVAVNERPIRCRKL